MKLSTGAKWGIGIGSGLLVITAIGSLVKMPFNSSLSYPGMKKYAEKHPELLVTGKEEVKASLIQGFIIGPITSAKIKKAGYTFKEGLSETDRALFYEPISGDLKAYKDGKGLNFKLTGSGISKNGVQYLGIDIPIADTLKEKALNPKDGYYVKQTSLNI